jgi:hypothetical protein
VGCQRLGLAQRPTKLAQKQALAAIGQVHLMRYYEDILNALGLVRKTFGWEFVCICITSCRSQQSYRYSAAIEQVHLVCCFEGIFNALGLFRKAVGWSLYIQCHFWIDWFGQ